MNLRLPEATEESPRHEAAWSGESQQQIVRDAVDRRLGHQASGDDHTLDELVATGVICPAQNPYCRVEPTVELPSGVSTRISCVPSTPFISPRPC